MRNIKSVLTKLRQNTLAECVGLIRLTPEVKELHYLEESMFDFLQSFSLEKLVAGTTRLIDSSSCNCVLQAGQRTLFLKIVDRKYVLYAATDTPDLNVTKYYSMLSLAASEL